MKLIGSKQEQKFRHGLKNFHNAFFYKNENPRLLSILKDSFPQVKTAYLLGWTPGQAEDIYRILINDDIVAWIELDKFDLSADPIVEHISVFEYQKKLKKVAKIELMIALDLASTDLNQVDVP